MRVRRNKVKENETVMGENDTAQRGSQNVSRDSQKTAIEFFNGNRNSPVLNLGDDPSNEENETDNILVVHLGTAVSVPRESVSATEGTPEAE